MASSSTDGNFTASYCSGKSQSQLQTMWRSHAEGPVVTGAVIGQYSNRNGSPSSDLQRNSVTSNIFLRKKKKSAPQLKPPHEVSPKQPACLSGTILTAFSIDARLIPTWRNHKLIHVRNFKTGHAFKLLQIECNNGMSFFECGGRNQQIMRPNNFARPFQLRP